jgi:hypothetical protein
MCQHLQRRSLVGPLAVILGLVCLSLPVLAFLEPVGVPFDHPVRVAYYLGTVAAFIVGSLLGLAALILGMKSATLLFKLPSIMLGAGGIIVNLLLLQILIGLCGPTVLWGSCNP